MKQLSTKEIQFIDNYLQKHDVVFVDIRAEMTDHIASAVEEKMKNENLAFYDAFKSYMIENRKAILKNNNAHLKYFAGAIISFSKTFLKFYNLILAISILGFFVVFSKSLNNPNFFIIVNKIVFYTVLIFNILLVIYCFLITKKRFVYLENLSSVLSVIYYFNLIFNGFGNNTTANIFSIALTVFLLFSFGIYAFRTIKKFQLNYL